VEFFNCALKLILLSCGEVEHFFCVVQEDCSFGLGLGGVDGAGENADFCIFGAFYRTIWFPAKDHAFDDFGLFEGASHDLDNADVVDVEVLRAFRQNDEDAFGDHAGEKVLAAGLFGGDNGADGLGQFGVRSYVFDLVYHEFCAPISI